jgi:hypothetical protein
MSKILNLQSTQQTAPTNAVQDEFIGSLPILEDSPAHSPFLGRVMEYGTRLTKKVNRRRGQARSMNSLAVLSAEPHVSYVARYKRSTGNVYDVDIGGFARMLVAAATATNYRPCIRAFRIREITVRGSTGAVGDSASVGLRYLGTNTNETNHIDDTMKIDVNAMVSKKPPRNSLAAFWHDVVTEELNTKLVTIQYFGSGECYVDVHLEVLLDVNRYVNFSLSGGSGLDVGGIYRADLSPGLDPVGVSSA